MNFLFKLYYICKCACSIESVTSRGQGMVSQCPLPSAPQNIPGVTDLHSDLCFSALFGRVVLETENRRKKKKSHKAELEQPSKPCLDPAATQEGFFTVNFPGFFKSTFCYK